MGIIMKVFYGIFGVLEILCGICFWAGFLTPIAPEYGCYAIGWRFFTLSLIFKNEAK